MDKDILRKYTKHCIYLNLMLSFCTLKCLVLSANGLFTRIYLALHLGFVHTLPGFWFMFFVSVCLEHICFHL